jgi:glycosyltransferase involved in cell wall biosynthesis
MIRRAKHAIRKTPSSLKRHLARFPAIERQVKNTYHAYLAPLSTNRREYNKWVSKHYPDTTEIERLRKESKKFAYQPLISILLPTYNTDPTFLRGCIESVIDQAYENWQLCIADDASPDDNVRKIIAKYAAVDPRIKYIFLEDNQHISGATNEASKLAKGEYISLFDHDDILWPNALYEVVKQLNRDRALDFIYTDEDKVLQDGKHHLDPFYKTDWNPTFLHSVNYITHFATIRRSLFEKVGKLRSGYDGAQDWDLFLRITRVTSNVCHIPKIVYSWRIHDASTSKDVAAKPYVVEAQKKALQDDLAQKGLGEITSVLYDTAHAGQWRADYKLIGNPKISVILAAVGDDARLKMCIDSIYKTTSYKNFEVIIVSPNQEEVSAFKKNNIKMVHHKKKTKDQAELYNYGAKFAEGDILVFIASNMQPLMSDWLEILAADAQHTDAGLAGPLVLASDKVHVRDAGIYPESIPNGSKMATTGLSIYQRLTQTQHLMLFTKHNVVAKSLDCIAIRRDTFENMRGFNAGVVSKTNPEQPMMGEYEIVYNPYVRVVCG